MNTELETAAEASAGGWLRWRRRRADLAPGTPCPNCATALAGAYCHGCGQLAESFHKSVWALAWEGLQSFFHLDGRLARTLPRLIARPGRLTREYLDGKRASQTPPLRQFLVILLLTFLVGQCVLDGTGADIAGPPGPGTEAARAEIAADPALSASERQAALAALDFASGARAGTAASDEGSAPVQGEAAAPDETAAFEAWLTRRLEAVRAEPKRFGLVLGVWAQRVALLMLPVSALILSLLFVRRRDLFVFDHLIFSMHSLSAQLLLVTAALIGATLVGPAAWWLLVLSPVHLFVHMRGAYRSGAVMTLLRMVVLFTATAVAAVFMLLLWLALAFNEMGG